MAALLVVAVIVGALAVAAGFVLAASWQSAARLTPGLPLPSQSALDHRDRG